mmetsp:Transcript_1078/g.2527  ORF Transcript_1078/g.2527 Transcript_1078/m.2527 type:complete len:353 (-) Transcript_1078:2285-3343(-)
MLLASVPHRRFVRAPHRLGLLSKVGDPGLQRSRLHKAVVPRAPLEDLPTFGCRPQVCDPRLERPPFVHRLFLRSLLCIVQPINRRRQVCDLRLQKVLFSQVHGAQIRRLARPRFQLCPFLTNGLRSHLVFLLQPLGYGAQLVDACAELGPFIHGLFLNNHERGPCMIGLHLEFCDPSFQGRLYHNGVGITAAIRRSPIISSSNLSIGPCLHDPIRKPLRSASACMRALRWPARGGRRNPLACLPCFRGTNILCHTFAGRTGRPLPRLDAQQLTLHGLAESVDLSQSRKQRFLPRLLHCLLASRGHLLGIERGVLRVELVLKRIFFWEGRRRLKGITAFVGIRSVGGQISLFC